MGSMGHFKVHTFSPLMIYVSETHIPFPLLGVGKEVAGDDNKADPIHE